MSDMQENAGMSFEEANARFMRLFGEQEPLIPLAGVKLIPKGKEIPLTAIPSKEFQGTLWCEAVRIAATENKTVVITKENLGCPAAAISLGLVDQRQTEPLEGKRTYTDMMDQPASPADFTNGLVYACKDSGDMQFALFGNEDTGRYETLGAALKAVSGMAAIQPAIMAAAVAYPPDKLDMTPDIVIIGVKPKQALLAIQGCNYFTGARFKMSTIGIRAVCADLTALPFLEQRLNGSFLCLGARAAGRWEGDLLGLGMPFSIFQIMVKGMEKSAKGFPYQAYP